MGRSVICEADLAVVAYVLPGFFGFANGLLGAAGRLIARPLGLQVGIVRSVADLLLGLALELVGFAFELVSQATHFGILSIDRPDRFGTRGANPAWCSHMMNLN